MRTTLPVYLQFLPHQVTLQAPTGSVLGLGLRKLAFKRLMVGAKLVFMLLIFGSTASVMAFDVGNFGKATEALGQTQDAVSTGQQTVKNGKQVISTSEKYASKGQEAVKNTQQAWSRSASSTPATPAAFIKNEGGVLRLMPVLNEGWSGRVRAGSAQLGLLDKGDYFVQRNSAYATPTQGQLLLSSPNRSSNWELALPAAPIGVVFDLATGRTGQTGRGFKLYALSVYADLPLRRGRTEIDPIEQHALLGASAVQQEWPRISGEILEPVGGKFLVYATESGVLFPSGFGVDGKLFTKDDPVVSLPQGYTVVTLDRRGFSFDRSREVVISFHDTLPASDIDLSRLGYAEAFQAFCSLMSVRYPIANARSINWVELCAEFAPAINRVHERSDVTAYAQVYAELGQRLGDGLFQISLPNGADPRTVGQVSELGLQAHNQPRGQFILPMPRVWLDRKDQAWVSTVAPNSPAAQAGLQSGAQILSINGETLSRYFARMAPLSRGGTETVRRLSALELTDIPNSKVILRVRQNNKEQTLELQGSALNINASPNADTTKDSGLAAYRLRSSSGKEYGYIGFNSFADANGKLDLWERTIASLNQARIPGLILDLRGNASSSYQLVPHFMASFFTASQAFNTKQYAQQQLDPESRVWRTRGGLGLPPQFALFSSAENSYQGKLVLLTGRGCSEACEIFAFWLQKAGKAHIVAAENSAGKAGHTTRINLPNGIVARVPFLTEIRASGDSYISGIGVTPNLWVPIDAKFAQQLANDGDPVLDAAVGWLEGMRFK